MYEFMLNLIFQPTEVIKPLLAVEIMQNECEKSCFVFLFQLSYLHL